MTELHSDEGEFITPVSATFDPDTGFIIVNLDKVSYGYLDQPVRYQGKIFQPKSELHITIISQDAEVLKQHVQSHPENLDTIEDLVLSTDWSFRKRFDFYYVTEEPEKETIIQMVNVPMLEPFLKDLSKQVGQGMVVPPTHVTLYTRGTERGIAIPNQAVFNELVKARVDPDEVQAVERPANHPGTRQGQG